MEVSSAFFFSRRKLHIRSLCEEILVCQNVPVNLLSLYLEEYQRYLEKVLDLLPDCLFEHFNTSNSCLVCLSLRKKISTSSPTFTILFDFTCNNSSTSFDRENVFDGHGERVYQDTRTGSHRTYRVNSIHKLKGTFGGPFIICIFASRAFRPEPRMIGVLLHQSHSLSKVLVLLQQDQSFQRQEPYRTCSKNDLEHQLVEQRRTCSRVCGIAPSVAATTGSAPSI